MDERELIAQAKKGNLVSFNRLVEAHQTLAYNVAYRLLGEEADACDATQDAFLSAYRALSGFRGENFRAWLLRIVTNACYDQLRAKTRRRSESLEALAERGDQRSWMAPNGQSPENHAEKRELQRVIQQAIETLPADQRAVVVLVDIQGLGYEEVAQATGVSLGTVKSRLSRARMRLRDQFVAHPELLNGYHRLNGEGC